MRHVILTKLSIIMGVIFFASCSADDLDTFDNNRYLYFDTETTAYTFAYSDASVTSHTIEIPVSMAGRYTQNDLTFMVDTISDGTTAILGTDFMLQNNQTFAKAQSSSVVKVNINRTANMQQDDLVIKLQLKSNDNFLKGHISVITITVSDRIIKPSWWANMHNRYIGSYTKTKLLLWLEFMNAWDGTDPWETDVYSYMTDYGTGNFIYKDYRTSLIIGSVVSFRNWLRTTKGDPIDPDTQRLVSEGLGSSI